MSVVDAIRGRDSTGATVKSPIPKCALLKSCSLMFSRPLAWCLAQVDAQSLHIVYKMMKDSENAETQNDEWDWSKDTR